MILIVDDDPAQRAMTGAMLTAARRQWVAAEDGASALDLLEGSGGASISLVLLDLDMPGLDGLEVLSRIGPARPDLPAIILTALGSVSNAVAAMRAGARDFLIKPVSQERLEGAIEAARRSGAPPSARPGPAPAPGVFSDLIARSEAMAEAITLAERGARSSIPILITGESGVGKEVFARAIHAASERRNGPFVAVNCGALPENLVESLLFGHEKGAFTGAVARRIGKFEEASGGVLFLDEIGELPLDTQVKLLRAVQEGEIDPVGGARTVRTDFRLVSATNRDLEAEVAAGRFREDLFYRISVFPLTLPPLRERREDIALLAEAFLRRFGESEAKRDLMLTPEALALLTAAPWPGNVRQLENAIHRAVVMCQDHRITPAQFSRLRPEAGASASSEHPFFGAGGHIRPLTEIETSAMQMALTRYKGSMSEAARRLEIGRSTLYRRTRGESA